MGRELRRVPKDWKHPKENGKYQPLWGGLYSKELVAFEALQKEKGLQEALDNHGKAPNKDEYMPEWPENEKTHIQMYEDTSEGTPISPVMDAPEALAQWLVDNKASAFADETATYDQWLSTIKSGWAVSAVFVPGKGLISGVAAWLDKK